MRIKFLPLSLASEETLAISACCVGSAKHAGPDASHLLGLMMIAPGEPITLAFLANQLQKVATAVLRRDLSTLATITADVEQGSASDNEVLRARIKGLLPRQDQHEPLAAAVQKIWAVYYSETDGSETYLGVVTAEDMRDAFVQARFLLLPGESPEELRVRQWNDERREKSPRGI